MKSMEEVNKKYIEVGELFNINQLILNTIRKDIMTVVIGGIIINLAFNLVLLYYIIDL